MGSWTKEDAEQELTTLLSEIGGLSHIRRFSAPHTRWLARTLRLLEEVFGVSSRYYQTLAGLDFQRSGTFFLDPYAPDGGLERIHQEAYVRQMDGARGILQAALDELSSSSIEDVYKGHSPAREASDILRVITLVEQKLRKVMREPPQRERQVQDAVKNLLIGADIEYSRETDSIEYSSKTYTPDFSLPRLDLALEVKRAARDGREKEAIAEIERQHSRVHNEVPELPLRGLRRRLHQRRRALCPAFRAA